MAEGLSGGRRSSAAPEDARLVDMKTEICAAIDALQEEKHRAVLEKYYLQGMTCKGIGQELGYDTHHVLRLKREALEILQIPKDDTT